MDFLLQPVHARQGYLQLRLFVPCHTVPEELPILTGAPPRSSSHSPSVFVLHERPDVLQQMVARFPAAYVDVAVVCVAAEAVSTTLQFFIQFIQQDVRQ